MQIFTRFITSTSPLIPHYSLSFSKQEIPQNLYFFNSGRSGLETIIEDLKNHFSNLIFLIPAYTCLTVVFALQQERVDFDFVDLDSTLDFDMADLDLLIEQYQNKKIVLIATALFSLNTREYKKLYKDIILIEDRAQNRLDVTRECDYQFVSYGKGKMVSSWNGGCVYTKSKTFKDLYNNLAIENEFFKSYLLTNIQNFITKYFYTLIEISPLNPEKISAIKFTPNRSKKLTEKKIFWILNSLESLDLNIREENSNYYLKNIDPKYLFEFKNSLAMLRFPIKKRVNFSGISFIYDYRYTYTLAKEKREKDLKVPYFLGYECSFLPTHNLIDKKYLENIVNLINEQN